MKALAVRESLWLNANPERVWQLITALEEWPSWHGRILRASWRGCPGWMKGHRFDMVTSLRRFPIRTGGRVVQVQPCEQLSWVGRTLGLSASFSIAIAPEGVGSRVHFGSHYQGVAARLAGAGPVCQSIARVQRGFLESLRLASERVVGQPA